MSAPVAWDLVAQGLRPAPGRGRSGDHFEPCEKKIHCRIPEIWARGCWGGMVPVTVTQHENDVTCDTPLERGRRTESNGV
jgi:hypothetical protein